MIFSCRCPVPYLGLLDVALEAHDAEFGLDQARGDHGNAEVGRDELLAQGVGERVHGVLGGAVDGAARVGVGPGHGGDVDDVARLALEHAGDEGLLRRNQRPDVHVEHLVRVLLGDLPRLGERERKPGVVHQNVNPAKLGLDLHRKRLDRLEQRET